MNFHLYEVWQITLCKSLNVDYFPCRYDFRIGIAENLNSGEIPINGLRHPPDVNTNGWFLWAGIELPQKADFFFPIATQDIIFWSEELMKYFGLPPG